MLNDPFAYLPGCVHIVCKGRIFVQVPSVEDLATGLADSTKQALSSAQCTLETAQQNWAHTLASISKWADEAKIGPHPRTYRSDAQLGDLWYDAVPRFELFHQVRLSPGACSASEPAR
jgi:hypothetical protein